MKIKLFVFSVLCFLVSCTKETNTTGNQTSNTTSESKYCYQLVDCGCISNDLHNTVVRQGECLEGKYNKNSFQWCGGYKTIKYKCKD